MGCEGNMARLILNCEGVGLVMRQLGRDIVMIGRAPSNQIVIDHPTVSAQHAVLLRVHDFLFAEGFKFNERDTGQWRFCH